MLAWYGVGFALLLTACAAVASFFASGNAYAQGYGMTAATHRRYALAGAVFAALFVAARAHDWACEVLLAPLALLVIFYAASFARAWGEVE